MNFSFTLIHIINVCKDDTSKCEFLQKLIWHLTVNLVTETFCCFIFFLRNGKKLLFIEKRGQSNDKSI